VEREPGRPLVLGDGSSGEESLSVLVQVADLRLLQASSVAGEREWISEREAEAEEEERRLAELRELREVHRPIAS
jgi:hypothetical protein